jgi:hypothetical protein
MTDFLQDDRSTASESVRSESTSHLPQRSSLSVELPMPSSSSKHVRAKKKNTSSAGDDEASKLPIKVETTVSAGARASVLPEKKGWRDCKSPGCKKCRQGNTQFCKEHGGGRKCQTDGCTKLARGKFFCAAHGGGKRCSEPNCIRMAVGSLGKCIGHGGGKRCYMESCGKAAQSASQYCFRHAQLVLKITQQKSITTGLESLAQAAMLSSNL